jgi:hypothetical protein
METMRSLGKYPAGRPLTADQIVGYHAARVLLLLYLGDGAAKIHSVARLAKLDFFVRSPESFAETVRKLKQKILVPSSPAGVGDFGATDREFQGWHCRCYQILSFLNCTGAITLTRDNKGFVCELTEDGEQTARRLAQHEAYGELCKHVERVKMAFAGMDASTLQGLITRHVQDRDGK